VFNTLLDTMAHTFNWSDDDKRGLGSWIVSLTPLGAAAISSFTGMLVF